MNNNVLVLCRRLQSGDRKGCALCFVVFPRGGDGMDEKVWICVLMMGTDSLAH